MNDEGLLDNNDSKGRKKPVTVVNGTRITVAFPFSQIKLQESAEETKELVAIVADLAQVVSSVCPGSDSESLQQRAMALLARLGGGSSPA
jgi:hypothetical protein